MIFLDANMFLRALIHSSDPTGQRMHRIASELFRQAERGAVEVTTSDAVIAEVAFLLTSKAHYGLAPDDAAGRISVMVRLHGVKLRDKRIMLGALDVLARNPRLGFIDALAVAHAHQPGIELATFDSDVDQLPGIRRWHPPNRSISDR